MGYDLYAKGIDEELEQFLNADPRDKNEVVCTALWREFGGESQAAIDLRIEQKDRRIETIEKEIEELQDELAEEKAERESLVAQRQELVTEEERINSDIDEIIDLAVELGAQIPEDNPKIGRLATDHFDGNVSEAYNALTERAEERDDVNQRVTE